MRNSRIIRILSLVCVFAMLLTPLTCIGFKSVEAKKKKSIGDLGKLTAMQVYTKASKYWLESKYSNWPEILDGVLDKWKDEDKKPFVGNPSSAGDAENYAAKSSAATWLMGILDRDDAHDNTKIVATDAGKFMVPNALSWLCKKFKWTKSNFPSYFNWEDKFETVGSGGWSSFWLKRTKNRTEKIGGVKSVDLAKVAADKAWVFGAVSTADVYPGVREIIKKTKYSDILNTKDGKKAVTKSSWIDFLCREFYKYGHAFKSSGQKTSEYAPASTESAEAGNSGVLLDHGGGTFSNKNEIYGNMKDFPSSFVYKNGTEIDYYDVAVPYNTRLVEISNKVRGLGWGSESVGNYFVGSKNTLNNENKVSTKKSGGLGMRNWAILSAAKATNAKIKNTKSKDGSVCKASESGLQTWVAADGTVFVMSAIQSFFYSKKQRHGNPQTGLGFKNAIGYKTTWGKDYEGHKAAGEDIGNIIDLIFTDGLVVHVIAIDQNADCDTNGGAGRKIETKNGKKVEVALPCGSVADEKKRSGTTNENYLHIAGRGSGHQLELVGDPFVDNSPATMFGKLFFGNSKRRIMYYRVYDANAGDPTQTPKAANEAAKHLSWKPDISTSDGVSSTDRVNGSDPEASSGSAAGLVFGQMDENSIAPIVKLNEAYKKLPTVADLTPSELKNLSMWEEDTAEDVRETFLVRWSRRIAIFAGIAIIAWLLLLYVAFWFDSVNNIVEVELLPILSVGRLRVAKVKEEGSWSVKEEKGHKQRSITHNQLLCVVVIGCALGVVIVSGKLFAWIWAIFKWVYGLFNYYF